MYLPHPQKVLPPPPFFSKKIPPNLLPSPLPKPGVPNLSKQMNDQDHLEGILSGDREAYRKTWNGLLPSIRRLVGKQGFRGDAEDLLSEAFIRLYQRAKQPGFRLTSKLETYLYGICRNLIGSQGQKLSYRRERTFADDAKYRNEPIPERDEKSETLETLLGKAMLQLDEPCRALLEHYFLEELSRKETARALGYSETHVSHKCKDCLNKLKKRMMDDPEFRDLF